MHNKILIVFGGFLASKDQVKTWANNLNKHLNFNKVFYYKGPNTVSYTNMELPVSKLANIINSLNEVPEVKIIGHSSGAFPAYEIISYLNDAVLKNTELYVLDSVKGTAWNNNLKKLKKVKGVSASYIIDSRKFFSLNYYSTKAVALELSGEFYDYNVKNSGIVVTNTMALHMAMISKKLSSFKTYNLDDYKQEELVTEWI